MLPLYIKVFVIHQINQDLKKLKQNRSILQYGIKIIPIGICEMSDELKIL